jgi:hypothetical protein
MAQSARKMLSVSSAAGPWLANRASRASRVYDARQLQKCSRRRKSKSGNFQRATGAARFQEQRGGLSDGGREGARMRRARAKALNQDV